MALVPDKKNPGVVPTMALAKKWDRAATRTLRRDNRTRAQRNRNVDWPIPLKKGKLDGPLTDDTTQTVSLWRQNESGEEEDTGDDQEDVRAWALDGETLAEDTKVVIGWIDGAWYVLPRGASNMALVRVVSREADADTGLFSGLLVAPDPDEVPTTWDLSEDEIWIAFANVDPTKIFMLDESLLLAMYIGERDGVPEESEEDPDIRPLYVIDMPTGIYRGVTTEAIPDNGSGMVELYDADGETGFEVEAHDWLLTGAESIAANTRVIVELINNDWWITAAACEPEEDQGTYYAPSYIPGDYLPYGPWN